MRKSLALLVVAGATSGAFADHTTTQLDDDTEIAAAITYKNLTLQPLLAKPGAKTGAGAAYLSLDEAFDKKVLKVYEKGDGGDVNTLTMENRSKLPLFIMSGEVVLGGKQDRIIGKDTIIPPSQRADVPVFCVEHGRWAEAGSGKQFRSAKAMAHTKLRVRASGRDNQSEVWSEVASKNDKRGTGSATGTYRQVAAGGGGVDRDVKPYAEHFASELGKVAGADRMVGVVVSLNGAVVGIEQFDSPVLFAKVRDKLLRSYYTNAVDLPVDAAAAGKSPSGDSIKAFVAAPEEAEVETVMKNGDISTERKKGKGVINNSLKASPSAPKPVYKSVQKDE